MSRLNNEDMPMEDNCAKIVHIEELVSIIVPVYNVRDYLERCIVSILNQTYQELEIIIIDDGSTDGSSELCDRLQERDKRIIVIHKKNGGLVSARKEGLRRARGRYVSAIDSDDWIEPDMISEMLSQATLHDADIVTSGLYREYNDICIQRTDLIPEGIYCDEERKTFLYQNMIFFEHDDRAGIWVSIWGKLIKTSLLKDVTFKLSDEIIYAEDSATVYACCVLAKRIIVTHDIYYHYLMRNDSLTHSSSSTYFKGINEVYLFLKSYFENSIYSSCLIDQLDVYFVKHIFFGINYYFGLKKEVSIPYYDFPKSMIPIQTSILIYGAGKVGQSYHKQICAEKLYQVAGWVDQEYQRYQRQGFDVLPVERVKDLSFDLILIAVKYEGLAEKIKQSLIYEFAIDESKILWLEPISIIDKYRLGY